jgi:hypothetical protein
MRKKAKGDQKGPKITVSSNVFESCHCLDGVSGVVKARGLHYEVPSTASSRIEGEIREKAGRCD